jgi:restriction system protein
LTRGGQVGEHENFALTVGTTGGGWRDVPDLTAASDRSFIKSVLAEVRPDVTAGTINNWAGQLFVLVNIMSEGDYVIMPLKGQEVVAIGEITSDYIFDSQRPSGSQHYRRVDWINEEVSRMSLAEDVRKTLGARMTICEFRQENVAERISALLPFGIDPLLKDNPGVAPEPTAAKRAVCPKCFLLLSTSGVCGNCE